PIGRPPPLRLRALIASRHPPPSPAAALRSSARTCCPSLTTALSLHPSLHPSEPARRGPRSLHPSEPARRGPRSSLPPASAIPRPTSTSCVPTARWSASRKAL